jgi:hypothetical protein
MAGTGPAPKPNRRRRNADTYADVQTRIGSTSDQLRGPELEVASAGRMHVWDPDVTGLVGEWWNTWRRAPQAEIFLDTDWSRLAMLIPLVAEYFTRPHFAKLAEIRQNESLLGATVTDRLKARIKVDGAEPAGVPAGVAAMDDYRNRLSG